MNLPHVRENIIKWLQGLDTYLQGKGAMKYKDEGETLYCCLGVAREVCKLSGSSSYILNEYVSLGLRNSNGGFFGVLGEDNCLAGLNDGTYKNLKNLERATFAQIKQFILDFPHLVFTDEVAAYLAEHPISRADV